MGKLVAIDGDALKIVMGIKEKELKDKKDSLREVNKHFCKLIATNEDNSLCDIYNEASFKPEYRFLSAYKERLFAKLNNFDTDNNYTCAGREEEIKDRISNTFSLIYYTFPTRFDHIPYTFPTILKVSKSITVICVLTLRTSHPMSLPFFSSQALLD